MAKCRRCGDSMYSAEKGICRECRQKWLNRRLENWKAVTDEFGQPTKDNLTTLKSAMKTLESKRGKT